MELFLDLANNLLKLLDAMSLYVMTGLLIAGVLKQLIPDDFVSSHLGKDSTTSVIKATLFGIPLPVCSCSVIPLAQGLKKEGASKGAVQSFLISTPITGVDSILATFSFFGLIFTVFRVISSVIVAIVVGLIQNFVENKEQEKIKFEEENKPKPAFSAADIYTSGFSVAAPKKQESSSCGCAASSCATQKSFSIKSVFSYAYGTLFSDMAKSLLIGLVLGAAFTTFMPQEYAKLLFDNQILTYFVILIFAMPLYTCATASLPIAAALMLQGMSAGAAFIFLTAGPATSAVTMSVVYKILGRTSLIIYSVTIAIMALIFGFGFDLFLGNIPILNISHEHESVSLISSIASFLMLVLIVYHLFKDKFSKKNNACCSNSSEESSCCSSK
ncbi:MAG: SO_0444 family Cu/Zn efflux transporter [Candidatus Marinarcus sp.]|uniref:SO_0444 family Cu/Zn efflux transporter n=1 Tax=Candidatus Marinarcus sp. TaxID=3100987 RepID=UPI003B00250E